MATVRLDRPRPAFTVAGATEPIVTTAIHAGHDLRPELADLVGVDETTRQREEDPFTDRLAVAGTRVVVHRSRFEVDLNRPEDEAVYLTPSDSWGLPLWKEPLSPEAVDRSLQVHRQFYAALARRLDRLAARGPFVVLDIHSYNHRRAGIPASDAHCPELNLGTGSLDRRRWAHVVDAFLHEMGARHVAGHPLDVRENVVFEGRHLAEWVHRRYPDRGCALALDFKKVFMDEWTGRADDRHVAELGRAIAGVAARLSDLVTREAA